MPGQIWRGWRTGEDDPMRRIVPVPESLPTSPGVDAPGSAPESDRQPRQIPRLCLPDRWQSKTRAPILSRWEFALHDQGRLRPGAMGNDVKPIRQGKRDGLQQDAGRAGCRDPRPRPPRRHCRLPKLPCDAPRPIHVKWPGLTGMMEGAFELVIATADEIEAPGPMGCEPPKATRC